MAPKLASYKRIIISVDGTWLSSDEGGGPSQASNVAKIARAISKTGIDSQENRVKQLVLYHSGLGAGDLPFQKAIFGALGVGLDGEVTEIYDFISNNYEPGDELFFFGFSRGAFTARSVAGLVADIGVLNPIKMSRFPEMWAAYRANTGGKPFRKSEWYLDNRDELGLTDVTIKVIGVWETVGELGVPEWPLVNLAAKVGFPINQQYTFHNTRASKYIEYAFQALAIDEKRIAFPPTLWHKTEDGPTKSLQQCWFPGVHSNIGGQAEQLREYGDHEEIGYNTFAWMVDNLSGLLTFDQPSIASLVEDHRRALVRVNAKGNLTNGWGCGPIVDNFAGLQGAFFALLGKKYRTPGEYPRGPDESSMGATNESVHPIVRVRKDRLRYDPVALRGWSAQEPSRVGTGWQWTKEGRGPMPEYVLSPDKAMTVAYEDGGVVKYKVQESMARTLCPADILSDLDRDNGVGKE
ncbi:uncharacterized protein DNG_08159 [Cephalotrichum gorgonifer]|uniref:T6SS Phospholipase effector Tle1-like catalytic domain-containing protein n=1 Tax=Cephalotrichum gorgonifer TaxID=2041049 RepID=A0AAE8N5Y3_9PEZI|nr:uncharacterized protein DNG_08159 [Cephalotrichum gorgonifer]